MTRFDSSRKDLLVYFGRSWKAIERKAEELKIKRARKSYCGKEPQEPEWLIGEMLGDGHITKYGEYKHTSKYLEYVIFLHNKFEEIGVPSKYYENNTFDKRTNKTYKRFLLRTPSVFKNLRKKMVSRQ